MVSSGANETLLLIQDFLPRSLRVSSAVINIVIENNSGRTGLMSSDNSQITYTLTEGTQSRNSRQDLVVGTIAGTQRGEECRFLAHSYGFLSVVFL